MHAQIHINTYIQTRKCISTHTYKRMCINT